jgi:hypothetical protein|tara:strand:- start:372 stop:575 length:204 start_codon:yes stop_codon:yes gene_type:complete
MSKRRAKEIVKNLLNTIHNMVDIKIVTSEQFPPARADKKKLGKIADKLIKKYELLSYKNKVKKALTE